MRAEKKWSKAQQKSQPNRTQAQKVVDHLNRHPSLTQRDAAFYYGIYRLAAVVHNLKRRGHQIGTKLIPWNGSHYARYFLIKKTD